MKRELRIVIRFVLGLSLVFPVSAYVSLEDYPLGAFVIGYPILVLCGLLFGLLPGAFFAVGYIPFGRKLQEWSHLANFALLHGLIMGHFLWSEWLFEVDKNYLLVLGPLAAGFVCTFVSFYSGYGTGNQHEGLS